MKIVSLRNFGRFGRCACVGSKHVLVQWRWRFCFYRSNTLLVLVPMTMFTAPWLKQGSTGADGGLSSQTGPAVLQERVPLHLLPPFASRLNRGPSFSGVLRVLTGLQVESSSSRSSLTGRRLLKGGRDPAQTRCPVFRVTVGGISSSYRVGGGRRCPSFNR